MADMGLPLAYGAGFAPDQLAQIIKDRLMIQEQQRRQAELEWQKQYQGGMLGLAKNRDVREGTLFNTELPGVQAETQVKVQTAPQKILQAGQETQTNQQNIDLNAMKIDDQGRVLKARRDNPDYYATAGIPEVLQKHTRFTSLGEKSPDEIDFTQQADLARIHGESAARVANIAANARILTDNPPAPKPSTGLERTTLGYYNRMRDAADTLDALEPELRKMSAAGAAGTLWAPNIFKTPTGQRYLQALRMYTEARLRKESGAAVPESEVQRDQMVFGFQVGDKDATTAQKQAARRQVADALAFSAGKAYEEYYGSPYKPGSDLVTDRGKVRMLDPQGQEFEADPDKVEFYESRGATRVQDQ